MHRSIALDVVLDIEGEESSVAPEAPASAAVERVMSLDVLRVIVGLLPAADYPTLRLVRQDMARAVDHTITSLTITRWLSKGSIATGFRRLQNVQKISITTKPDWDLIDRLARNMSQLCSLTITDKVNSRMSAPCAASLTALTRLDLGSNSTQVPVIPLPKRGNVQLPGLKAASFSSKHTKAGPPGANGTLADIAAFAPNLQQLYCSHLEIQPKEAVKLPHCTHFGAQEVLVVDASSKAAGAAAFPAAFPRLQVFSCMPDIVKIHAEQKHFGKWNLAPAELLNLCKAAHSLRGFGPHVARSIGSAMPKASGQFMKLQALCIRAGMANSTNFLGIGALKGLQHLELVFDAPLSRHGPSPSFRATFLRDMQLILRQSQHISNLTTLALPATLLCSTCCNEGFSAAAAHAELLQVLDAVVTHHRSLQKIAFLDVQRLDYCSYFAECCWTKPASHEQQVKERFERMGDRHQQRLLVQDVTRSDQQQDSDSEESGKRQLVWELKLGLLCTQGSVLNNQSGGGMWGVYGPETW